jgi:hypothetical protein
MARKAIEGNRNFVFSYRVLALGYARLGHADEAAQAVRRLVRKAPAFVWGRCARSGLPTRHACNPISIFSGKCTCPSEDGCRNTLAKKSPQV